MACDDQDSQSRVYKDVPSNLDKVLWRKLVVMGNPLHDSAQQL